MSHRHALPFLILVLAMLALPGAAAATTSDLAIETTAPATTPEEANFELKVTVTNNGPDEAKNVYMEYTIPLGSKVAFVSATPSQGSGTLNLGSGLLSFNFGSIAGGGSANIVMTYAAKAPQKIETTPTVTFKPPESQEDPDLANNSVTTDITVTGIAATAPSFPDQPLGTIGPAQIVTVTNSSAQSVTFGPLPVSGAASPDFFSTSISSPCAGATLAPTESCRLALRFAPSELGARAAQIDLAPTGGPVDPLSLELSGNGIPLPVDTGPPGLPGPPGPPAFKLALASASKRLSARHGRGVVLSYASTLDAHVVLDVLRGKSRVAEVEGSATEGANRIRWNGKRRHGAAKRGRYTLRLIATSGGQTATLEVPLKLR